MTEYALHFRDGLSLFDGEQPPRSEAEEGFARFAEAYGQLCSMFGFPIGVLDA